jgi:hypothetical protein
VLGIGAVADDRQMLKETRLITFPNFSFFRRKFMKALLFAAAAILSANTAIAGDDVTCAYVVELPGVNIEYFKATGSLESSARWEAEQICLYNDGLSFGPEVCSEITCD